MGPPPATTSPDGGPMATYLVTGAAGFIGQHLVALLASRGDEVHAVDVELHPEAPAQVQRLHSAGAAYRRLDLTDPDQVADLPEVDGVFHLAALNGRSEERRVGKGV